MVRDEETKYAENRGGGLCTGYIIHHPFLCLEKCGDGGMCAKIMRDVLVITIIVPEYSSPVFRKASYGLHTTQYISKKPSHLACIALIWSTNIKVEFDLI